MEDPPRPLPDDVLEDDVLRRLPPRALAVSRSVCRSWRAAIDAHGTLQPDLLPLSPAGILISLERSPAPPLLFAPPPPSGRKSAAAAACSKLESCNAEITDSYNGVPFIFGCCNGLLLLFEHVVNPATRRSARLPPCPAPRPPEEDFDEYHLLFDPSVSPHYEVVVIPCPDDYRRGETLVEEEEGSSEWPPSPCVMWVYSSASGMWENKAFVREAGGPAGTLAEAQSAREPEYRHAVYCHGALYAHCKGDFIMRITLLSDCKYQVIAMPEGVNSSAYFYLRLLKSKYGVYLAYIHDQCQLRVWFLNESSGKTEWVLKYDINLQAVDAYFYQNPIYPITRPWSIIHGDNNYGRNKRRAQAANESEWDFDNGNIIELEGTDENHKVGFTSIFGLHPYKEVAFLHLSMDRVVAYHLDGSKVQDLGLLHVPYTAGRDFIDKTFVYSPCWVGELSDGN